MTTKNKSKDYKGKVTIVGREYDLIIDKKTSGGEFYCWGKKSSGRGQIFVENTDDARTMVEILLHEVMETILTEENKRYYISSLVQDNGNLMFMFTHEYFDTLCPKILTAMLETGFIKLVDRRTHS